MSLTPDQRIVVSGSRDGGDTWAVPVVINDGSLSGTAAGNLWACPVVDSSGALYVSWHNINTADARMDRDADGLWAAVANFDNIPDTVPFFPHRPR